MFRWFRRIRSQFPLVSFVIGAGLIVWGWMVLQGIAHNAPYPLPYWGQRPCGPGYCGWFANFLLAIAATGPGPLLGKWGWQFFGMLALISYGVVLIVSGISDTVSGVSAPIGDQWYIFRWWVRDHWRDWFRWAWIRVRAWFP